MGRNILTFNCKSPGLSTDSGGFEESDVTAVSG